LHWQGGNKDMAILVCSTWLPDAILDFVRSEIWRQGQSRLTRIYLHTKYGEDVLKGGRIVTIFVLDFSWILLTGF